MLQKPNSQITVKKNYLKFTPNVGVDSESSEESLQRRK
jgi:hypothetical protein